MTRTVIKITGASNAGGPRQLPMRTRRAARVAQFCRWTAKPHLYAQAEAQIGAPLSHSVNLSLVMPITRLKDVIPILDVRDVDRALRYY